MRIAVLVALSLLLVWAWRNDVGGALKECQHYAEEFHTSPTWRISLSDVHCEFDVDEVRANRRKTAI